MGWFESHISDWSYSCLGFIGEALSLVNYGIAPFASRLRLRGHPKEEER
jgi:hypothetical protein